MNKIKVVEWFGGIGAATQALKRLQLSNEIEVVDYVELDKHAVKSYNAINGTNFVPIDINNVDVNGYGEVDVLIAGWPCQDYSVAGLGKGLEGTRSSLILLTIDKVRQMTIKPKYILLENVKGLLADKHKQDLYLIKEYFQALGYNWSMALLNSKYFGVPQARERVFVVLTREDLPYKSIKHLKQRNSVDKVLRDILDFSLPTETISIKECLDNKHVIIKDNEPLWVLSDGTTRKLFTIKGDNQTINIPHTSNHTNNVMATVDGQAPTIMAGSTRYVYIKNTMKQYNGKDIKIDLHKLTNQNREDINRVAVLGELQIQCQTGECYKLPDHEYCDCNPKEVFEEHSFNQKKDFLGIDGVVKTLRAGDCDAENKIIWENELIHYRKLSSLECWRLMGFSDEAHNKCLEIGVSHSQLCKQAGNSIVVNVLEEIFKEIF